MSEITEQFIELFQGNRTAVGLESGGCLRLEHAGTYDWTFHVVAHLKGTAPIGVYPMIWDEGIAFYGPHEGWKVHWGCIDFDEGEEESWVHAVNVRTVLERFGITAWIERSRSKGFHVWVFADSWVPAGTMRSALLAACQIVDAPTKEINPKQVELGEGQLGNYVRLPYPGRLGDQYEPNRRVVLSPGGRLPLHLEEFVQLALRDRTNEAQLSQVAGLLKQKPKSLHKNVLRSLVHGPDDKIERLSGLAYTILMEGPKEGADRSTTLWKLATRIFDDGTHTFEEALDIMIQADLAWGKFMERGDSGERELRRMLEKVWDG